MQLKSSIRCPGLLHRHIEVGPRSLAETPVLDVFDDANHGQTRIPIPPSLDMQLVADGLLSPEEPPCECLIDDGYERGLAVVAFGKIAPLDESNPHEIEVARRDRVPEDAHVLAAARYIAANLYFVGP